jgi:hypothetical protein
MAVALPMPPEPPVISTVLPAIGPLGICVMFVLPSSCHVGNAEHVHDATHEQNRIADADQIALTAARRSPRRAVP